MICFFVGVLGSVSFLYAWLMVVFFDSGSLRSCYLSSGFYVDVSFGVVLGILVWARVFIFESGIVALVSVGS